MANLTHTNLESFPAGGSNAVGISSNNFVEIDRWFNPAESVASRRDRIATGSKFRLKLKNVDLKSASAKTIANITGEYCIEELIVIGRNVDAVAQLPEVSIGEFTGIITASNGGVSKYTVNSLVTTSVVLDVDVPADADDYTVDVIVSGFYV